MSAPTKPRTMASALAARSGGVLLELRPRDEFRWPSARYKVNPLAFFREVLGVEPWSRQIDVIEAVRDNKRVAIASGHKVSKSHTAVGLALWFYCSFPDARVVMSSTTSRQVDQILWRELRMMKARSVKPIDGIAHELARSGLKSADFREIVGFTAREAEAVAGISGKNLLYILDEASGIGDEIFEAIEGNRAGGAWLVMFSNPTKTEGEFFEAFHGKSRFYKTLTISSEESPNVVAGHEVIPGLASREWIDEKREEWGEDSVPYIVRVKGQFATKEDGKILTLHDITQAEIRWHDMPTPTDRLFVGVDPAGPGNAGDESAFALRRGTKILRVVTFRGLSEEAHLAHLLGLIKGERSPREQPPVVVLDREGSVGARVYGFLKNHAETFPLDFELVGVRSSERATREPRMYGLVRDELYANLQHWIRRLEGAIPEDVKLLKELHSPEFSARGIPERLRATSKEDLKKLLGRSPDRGDAVALSVWEPVSIEINAAQNDREGSDDVAPVLNPYDGIAIWNGRQ